MESAKTRMLSIYALILLFMFIHASILANAAVSPTLTISPNSPSTTSTITITALCPSGDACDIMYPAQGQILASGSGTATYTYPAGSFQAGTYEYFYAYDVSTNTYSSGQVLTVVAPSFQTQPYCLITGSYTTMGNCVVSAIPLAFFGVLFSFLLVAISYMLGSVFNISALKGWYQNELKEASKSILIIVVIFSLFIVLSSIAASYVGPSSTSLTTSSSTASSEITNNIGMVYNALQTSYFTPQLQSINGAFYTLLGLYDGIGLWKSMTLSVYLPFPIIPVFTIASLDFGVDESLYVSSVISSISDPGFSLLTDIGKLILVPVTIILQVQQDLLASIIAIGLGVLLPVGIVLRAVPILRPLGGTFLALGIGAALVYPALLLAINVPISNYIPPLSVSSSSPQCPSGWNGISCAFYNGVISAEHDFLNAVSASSQVLTGFGNGMASYVDIYPAFNTILSQSFLVAILQFILFILDLIIGIVIVQHIASLLGGSLRLGIGRMKLAEG